ncbi:MAG: metallophosphoesterase [Fibrobacteres bacterium]|nr:metallophosphoesterase [Fibrobacterota bacterium]
MKKVSLFIISLFIFLNAQESYRFVILGDRTGSAQDGVFPKIIDQTLKLTPSPLFYTNVGDQIQGYSKDTAELSEQWKEFDSEMKTITEKYKYYPIYGNHDITYDNVEPYHNKKRGPSYYSYDIGPDRFIVLDNSRFNNPAKIDKAQLAFLKKTLNESKKVRNLFCFYHKPMFDATPREPIMDDLHKLFKEGGVDYVINGHYHRYNHGIRDNIHYVTIGSSGGRSDGKKKDGSIHHYAVVDVSAKEVNIKPITIDGDTMNINWVVDSSKVAYWKVMCGLTINPIELTWKDSLLNSGVFKFNFKNDLSYDVTLNIEWQPNETYTDKQYQLSALNGTMLVKKDSTGSISFDFKTVSGQILTGPLAKVTAFHKNDTITFLRRPLIQKTIGVDRTAKPVIIDGEHNEEIWVKAAMRVQNTFGGLNRVVDYDSTWTALSYDDKNLYVAFKCYDPSPDSIVKPENGPEKDSIKDEDLIRFFISSFDDTAHYKIIYLSPSGSLIDAIAPYYEDDYDYKWNGVDESKVLTKSNMWQGEFKVSWKSLGFKKPTPFYINCKRPSFRFPKRKGKVFLQLPSDMMHGTDAKTFIIK